MWPSILPLALLITFDSVSLSSANSGMGLYGNNPQRAQRYSELKRRSTSEGVIVDEMDGSYNKFERPDNSKPVYIDVFIHFESLREITSEVTLDFYLLQFWNDSRLRDQPIKKDELKITGRQLPDELWYPDTYFLLVRDLLYSSEEQYIIVTGGESLEFNRKVRLKTPCTPNVLLFPFDVVKCNMVLSSFGYDDSEVVFNWANAPESLYIDKTNNNVDHLGFFLKGTLSVKFAMPYGDRNYSTLKTVIYLERKFSAYLIQVYFPAALIVILSWTIFWINLEATPARASLGVTTVLTMLTLATQSTSQNAKHVNNKVTAIDIYLWACFVFVIFAMIEFALSDFTTHSAMATAASTDDPKRKISTESGRKVSVESGRKISVDRRDGSPRGEHVGRVQKRSSSFKYSDCETITEDEDKRNMNVCVINVTPPEEQNGKPFRRKEGTAANHPYNNNIAPHNNNFLHVTENPPKILPNKSSPPNHFPLYNRNHQNMDCNPKSAESCLLIEQSAKDEFFGDNTDIIANKYLQQKHYSKSKTVNFTPLWNKQSNSQELKTKIRTKSRLILLKAAEKERLRQKSLHMVNNFARVLFPLSFLIFNVCYWTYLINKVSTNDDYKQQEGFVEMDNST